MNLAEVNFAIGETDKAIELAQNAYNLLSWSHESASSEQVLCLNLSLYLMTKDPRRSCRITKKSLDKFPNNWELLHNHAEACRLIAIDYSTNQTTIVEEGISCAEKALEMNPGNEYLRITYAGLLRLGGFRERFFPYLDQLMEDVGEHSVPARLLYLDAHIDEGNFDFVEKQIETLSQFKSFDGLLEGVKNLLNEERKIRSEK